MLRLQGNPDTCYDFRGDLMDAVMSLDCDVEVILSDIHKTLHDLSGWFSASDQVSFSILLKLRKTSTMDPIPCKHERK
ncbi:hypothetical protein TNCV_4231151 [Trichonephila clavipes]|uniref:Uncharacterized protein n=1 Tax=Trichonephila clavipes TaxID=2585209 RepID=A0A8X6SNL8_TRICX|nr:hypothetical protein TNCV_4231151 [Trichonephila clavipes]